MPVLAVKSLPSSTSAFAGSQAAQHKVKDLAWACAFWTGAAAASPAARIPATSNAFVMFGSLLRAAPANRGVPLERTHRLSIAADARSIFGNLAFPLLLPDMAAAA